MSHRNDITVRSYDQEYQTWIDKTASQVSGSVKDFIETFLSYVQKDSRILEIGSGAGRDSDYIEGLGYTVLRTDAARNFVEYMAAQHHEARVLNIVQEAFDQQFDAVFANAVFLHFDDDDFRQAIGHVRAMLKAGGIFALSLHEGSFRGMSDHKHSARYFQEWSTDDITRLMTDYGFQELNVLHGESISKRKNWIMLVLRKV